MQIIIRWYRRVAAVLAIIAAAVLVPSTAWANPAAVTEPGDTLAKGKAVAVAGGLAALCCLLVVAAVAVAAFVIIRRRRH